MDTNQARTAAHFRDLLADFGEVMLELQLFELGLFALVDAQHFSPGQIGTEERTRRVERLWSLPAGQLRQEAHIEDEQTAALLADTVRLRNRLVHGWLFFTGMDLAAGTSTMQQERADLSVALRSVRAVRQALDRELERALASHDEEVPPERALELWRDTFGPGS
jgi:hypothetical protein